MFNWAPWVQLVNICLNLAYLHNLDFTIDNRYCMVNITIRKKRAVTFAGTKRHQPWASVCIELSHPDHFIVGKPTRWWNLRQFLLTTALFLREGYCLRSCICMKYARIFPHSEISDVLEKNRICLILLPHVFLFYFCSYSSQWRRYLGWEKGMHSVFSNPSSWGWMMFYKTTAKKLQEPDNLVSWLSSCPRIIYTDLCNMIVFILFFNFLRLQYNPKIICSYM